MSNYNDVLVSMKKLQCTHCGGHGRKLKDPKIRNSVTPSGESNTVTCPKCYGTGWDDGVEKRKLVIV